MRGTLTSVEDVPGGCQIMMTQTFELEGGEKPVCVAESLVARVQRLSDGAPQRPARVPPRGRSSRVAHAVAPPGGTAVA